MTRLNLSTTSSELCPFHNGPETLDGLLAEIGVDEQALLDAALDLRMSLMAKADAETCLVRALQLRTLLDGRHYLAFYRFRRWLSRVLVVQARAGRGEAWQTLRLPLDCARVEEVVDACAASVRERSEGLFCAPPQVRFTFVAPAMTRVPEPASIS